MELTDSYHLKGFSLIFRVWALLPQTGTKNMGTLGRALQGKEISQLLFFFLILFERRTVKYVEEVALILVLILFQNIFS